MLHVQGVIFYPTFGDGLNMLILMLIGLALYMFISSWGRGPNDEGKGCLPEIIPTPGCLILLFIIAAAFLCWYPSVPLDR